MLKYSYVYALINSSIFTGEEILKGKSILIDNKIIAAILDVNDIDPKIKKINLSGKTVVPGFIDIQVNGGEVFCLMRTQH